GKSVFGSSSPSRVISTLGRSWATCAFWPPCSFLPERRPKKARGSPERVLGSWWSVMRYCQNVGAPTGHSRQGQDSPSGAPLENREQAHSYSRNRLAHSFLERFDQIGPLPGEAAVAAGFATEMAIGGGLGIDGLIEIEMGAD